MTKSIERSALFAKGLRQCKTCLLIKPATTEYFYFYTKDKYNLFYSCIDCARAVPRKSTKKPYIKPDNKECVRCMVTKPFTSEYFPNGKSRSGLQGACRECKSLENARFNDPEYKKAYYEANKEKEKERVKAWRKKNTDKATAVRLRRQGLIFNSDNFEPVEIDKLYERDNSICGLCQTPVDQLLKWPDQMTGSIDHIIPLSKGGEHNYDNTQLAHWICNVKKGNRT